MKLILSLTILYSSVAMGQQQGKQAYDLSVHVASSRFENHRSGLCEHIVCEKFQHLDTIIDGKKFELEARASLDGLLKLGNYQARVVKDEQYTPAQFNQKLELVFSDGSKSKFSVIGESE